MSCLVVSAQAKVTGQSWAAPFFWFGRILGSASRAEFPVCLSNHVGFMPKLLYSSTHHSPESFTHLKSG